MTTAKVAIEMPELEITGDIPPNMPAVAPRDVEKTTHRTITKRAVMWLGQTCNLRCYFCYFLNRIADSKHPEHDFMTLDKAKKICHTLRHYYGCTSIDIQGGEPTIFPGILDLISYCREIGLYPTLITNGLHLAKPGVMEQFKEAGIRDFLVSLHGIGEIHDEVVCRKGAYQKIIKAIERMVECDVPFRINCTMSKPVVPILTKIAEKAIHYGANGVNYIAFNPFEDQETGIRTHENVAKYSEIKEPLTQAMDMLEEHDIEVNVRYMPLCVAEPRHRKNFYNFQQLTYEHHEWDYQSWLWTGMQPQRMKEGELTPTYRLGRGARRIYRANASEWRDWYNNSIKGKLFFNFQRFVGLVEQKLRGKHFVWRREAILRPHIDLYYQFHEGCADCASRNICDGFHGDYANFYGTDEAVPIKDHPPTDDPLHYIKDQQKVVEPEDRSWALKM